MSSKPKTARKSISNEPSFRRKKFISERQEVVSEKNIEDTKAVENFGCLAPNEKIEVPEDSIFFQLPKAISDSINDMQKKAMSPPIDEIIDNISFSDGKNTLKIVFIKKQNRMYRIQIFLNDEIEIRPVTYTGSNTAETFWKLLKGALKN